MTHRTFRSLDEPPKLLGFSATQWCWLLADLAIVLGLVFASGMPAKAALTLLAFAVGLPATLAYVSESGGIQPGRLLADAVRWRLSPRTFAPDGGETRPRRGSLETRLGVLAIEPDGLLIRTDATLVRYLEVVPVNPLAMDAAAAERVSAGLAQAAARLTDGQSLQLYVHATPLQVEELLAVQAHRCEQAAGAAEADGHAERARALRALGVAHERTIRTTVESERPPAVRFVVACPYRPRRGGMLRREPLTAEALERARGDSARHLEGIREDLESAGVETRVLDGAGVLDLVAARLDPERYERGEIPASFLHPELVAPYEEGAEAQIIAALCAGELGLSECSHLTVGGQLERCLFVSQPPEQTWLGWLWHLMTGSYPFALSVHVQATDRYRERGAQRRRHRRLYGINRGIEATGKPVSPDARLVEQDAAELNEQLAASAGAGIYRVGIYAALKAPVGEQQALADACQTAGGS